MNSRSERNISQDLKRTLRANNKATIYNGTAIASNQGKVLVYVPGLGQQIQAIAMGAVPTGPCQIYKTNSGWVVKSEVTNQVTREQGSDRRARERARSFRPGNIKILFSRPIQGDPNNRREYWLGGDREEPIKVGEDLVAGLQGTFYLHNTGRGKKDYLLCRGWLDIDTGNPSNSKFYVSYKTGRTESTQVVPFDSSQEDFIFYYAGNGCFIIWISPKLITNSGGGGGGGGYDSGGGSGSDVTAIESNGIHSSAQGSIVTSIAGSSRTSDTSISITHKHIRVTADGIDSQSVSFGYQKSSTSTSGTPTTSSYSGGYSLSTSLSPLGLGRYKAVSGDSGNQVVYPDSSTANYDLDYEVITPYMLFYHKLSSLTAESQLKHNATHNLTHESGNINISYSPGKRLFLKDVSTGDKLAFSTAVREMVGGESLAGNLPIERGGELRNPVTIEFEIRAPYFKFNDYPPSNNNISSSIVASWLGIEISHPGFLVVKNNHENEENSKGFWEYEGDIELIASIRPVAPHSIDAKIVMNITKRKAINWHWKVGAPLNRGKLETTQFSPIFYQKKNQEYISSFFPVSKMSYDHINGTVVYGYDRAPGTTPIINFNKSDTTLTRSVAISLDYVESENEALFWVPERSYSLFPYAQISQVNVFHSDQTFWDFVSNSSEEYSNSIFQAYHGFWNWTGKKFFNTMFLNSVLESDQVLWVEEMTVKSGSPPTLVRKWHPVEVYSLKCESEVKIHQVSAWLP